MKIGYARVSSDEQNLALQISALEKACCDSIFMDQGVSGKLASRPGLDEALGMLRKDDTLVVWRLDRLGRSIANLIKFLDELNIREVQFNSIMECIDTNSSGGRLTFHVLAALAEFERSLISERTRAGMAAAKAQGKHVGRRPSLNHVQCGEAIQLIQKKGYSFELVAQQFSVHPRTLRRLLGKHAS